jgi:hypothetical protein
VQVIDFPLTQAAAVLRARTEPALTLPVRLASTVSVAQAAAIGSANAHIAAFLPKKATLQHCFMIPALFDRVMAWPHLRNAFYRDLVDYDKNAFMPGVDDLPQDLIMLVQVNQYFIDAVMGGANFEMIPALLGARQGQEPHRARAARRHGADAPVEVAAARQAHGREHARS